MEKVHAVVARSTFRSQNVQSTWGSDNFLTIRWPFDVEKVHRTPGVLTLFTSKCASRHNGVHFFNISTPKSGSELTCFATFDFQMCSAPQSRSLFPHRNFQKSSETDVFCHFLLSNVLRFRHLNFQKASKAEHRRSSGPWALQQKLARAFQPQWNPLPAPSSGGFPCSRGAIQILSYTPFTVQAKTPGSVFAWPGLGPIALPNQAGQMPHVVTMALGLRG